MFQLMRILQKLYFHYTMTTSWLVCEFFGKFFDRVHKMGECINYQLSLSKKNLVKNLDSRLRI